MITFGRLIGNSLQIQKLTTSENQFELFKKLYSLYDRVFILESLIGPEELSEMSVIGFDPKFVVSCDYDKFTVKNRKGITVKRMSAKEPLSSLRDLMPKVNDYRFRYIGGAVGYLSYDAVRFWEDLPIRTQKKKKYLKFPLLEFGIYEDGLLFDHKENQAYYFFLGESRLDELQYRIARAKNKITRFSYSRPYRNVTNKGFKKMVTKAKQYIYDGDIFQVVLAKSIKFTVNGDLFGLYSNSVR